MCATKFCEASELMHQELGVWIGMFNLLKSDVYQGQTLQILEMAAGGREDIEVFSKLDNVLNAWRKEQASKR